MRVSIGLSGLPDRTLHFCALSFFFFSCGSASWSAIKMKIVSPGGWRDTQGAFWNKGPVIVAFYRVLWANAIRIITSLIFKSGHLKGLGRSIPFFLPEENGIKLPRMTYAPMKAVYLRAKVVIFHRNHGGSDCCHEGWRLSYVCQQLSNDFFFFITSAFLHDPFWPRTTERRGSWEAWSLALGEAVPVSL